MIEKNDQMRTDKVFNHLYNAQQAVFDTTTFETNHNLFCRIGECAWVIGHIEL